MPISIGLIPASKASNIATKAIKTISIAPTFKASFKPSVVPEAIASTALTYGDFSEWVFTVPSVSGVEVSGRKSFAR